MYVHSGDVAELHKASDLMKYHAWLKETSEDIMLLLHLATLYGKHHYNRVP